LSDLRKQLEAEAYKAELPLIDRAWPIIEAALQKRDRLRDQINDAYVRTETALNEANKLLEQTIEVLEGLAGMAEGLSFAHWWSGNGQPLLDNLKAWKKEPK
jgi:hypothetical protein